MRETTEQVLERVIAFRRAILCNLTSSSSTPEPNAPPAQTSLSEDATST